MIQDYNFIVILMGSCTTIITIIVAACYRSKCKHCSFCGLQVDRDIQSEIRQDSNNNRLSLSGIPGPITPPLQHISPV